MASSNIFVNLGGLFGGSIVGQSISGMSGEKGSGTAGSEKRLLAPFDYLKSSISGDILVRRGDEWSILVEADDNIVPLIKTDVSGGALRISAAGSFSTLKPIKLTVLVAGDHPNADLLGSGDLHMHDIDQKRLSVNLQGSGDVQLSGSVEALDLKVMGSGDIDAKRLRSKDTAISLMGSGDVDAHASESVNVTLMGSGDVRVTGSPSKMRSSSMGSGDVRIS